MANLPSSPARSRVVPRKWAWLAAAFAVAGLSDLLSISLTFLYPAQVAVDLATGVVLFLLLGRNWLLLPALIAEAVPGLALFPSWVLVVGSIGLYGTIRRPAAKPPAV